MPNVPASTPFASPPADGSEVRAAIAHAAEATGVDFDYLLTKAKLESSLDPDARARTSSAAGLYQFIGSTWLDTLDRHGAAHGLGWADGAIGTLRGRASVRDPDARAAIMDMRHDPRVASLMAAELARDNAAGLAPVLGRAPDGPELYLSHFLGLEGATRFLTALAADPSQSAVRLFPKPAAANAAIFHHGNGAARSVGEVMGVIRQKYERAQGSENWVSGPQGGAPGQPVRVAVVSGFSAPAMAPANHTGQPQPAARPSMAEVLRTTFLSGPDQGQRTGAPGGLAEGRVRDAYERLRSFGL